MNLRVREWRLKRRESLYTLAEKSGVHFTTIVRVEQGRLSPTVKLLEKLAVALRVHVRDLFPPKRPRGRRTTGGEHGKTR